MKIADIIPVYLNHLKALGRAKRTVQNTRNDLRPFMRFLAQEQILNPEALSHEIMAAYQQDLAFHLTAKGTLLSLRSQGQLLSTVKGFTRFLKYNDYLINDPGAKIQLPRKPKTLPKAILSQAEIKRLLKACDMRTCRGYRNRVIVEILYDTAVRRAEMSCMRLSDLELTTGFVRVSGKGAKERVVPLSQRVCELIKNYIIAIRPQFVQDKDPGLLILNRWGQKMKGEGIRCVVKRCAELAGIKKNVTTHGLRHTCATHMLKNGAPVRHIQEMLGHESLESTQIYTRVTINDLKRIHSQYHPSESMK
jgi:integrase/recombinase XerD